MANINSGMAGKLKNLARGIKNEGTVKKSGDKKQSDDNKKKSIGDEKLSGRKN